MFIIIGWLIVVAALICASILIYGGFTDTDPDDLRDAGRVCSCGMCAPDSRLDYEDTH